MAVEVRGHGGRLCDVRGAQPLAPGTGPARIELGDEGIQTPGTDERASPKVHRAEEEAGEEHGVRAIDGHEEAGLIELVAVAPAPQEPAHPVEFRDESVAPSGALD